jgi:MoaA/NifB/PqqE/SkfB family radical SAM enzyme
MTPRNAIVPPEAVVTFRPRASGETGLQASAADAAGGLADAIDVRAPVPTEAIISVTNRCDARCTMCNIWQLDRAELLSAEDYRRGLPATLRNVNLTGGEALLRPDIVEVAQAIHEAAGRPRIILATNGFRTERTIRTIERIRAFVPELGIAVSLDGDAPTHDRMRGVPDAHRRAVATLRALRQIGISDVRIGFTATAENLDQLLGVHALSRELGVEFAATVAQNSEVYYATDANGGIDPDEIARHFGALIAMRMRSASPKDWLRAYFDHGVIHFARTGARPTACDAASGFFFLAPTGDVYPCLTLPRVIGNIRTQAFDALWRGEHARRVREEVRHCTKCWMMCTARTELKRRPVSVASWVVRGRLKAVAAAAVGRVVGVS